MSISPVEVTPGIYRGPQPQTDVDFETLKNLGVNNLLDLETGAPLLSDGSPLEESLLVRSEGMTSYAHPLGEILPPTQSELALALKFIMSEGVVYVHCKAGVDRTGMVIAYFRMHQQSWSKTDAVAEMKRMGMHPWYWWWAWFL